MENLLIEPTQSSPKINFDFEQNKLEIQGASYPENTAEFYQPVLSWLEEYLQIVGEKIITLNLGLVYFNTSSSKILMDIFEILDQESEKGKKIVVNWFYDKDNESALEAGEEFQEDIEFIEFNILKQETPKVK